MVRGLTPNLYPHNRRCRTSRHSQFREGAKERWGAWGSLSKRVHVNLSWDEKAKKEGKKGRRSRASVLENTGSGIPNLERWVLFFLFVFFFLVLFWCGYYRFPKLAKKNPRT